MFTIPQLKQAAEIIAAEKNMTAEQARLYIGELNRENPAAISDILNSGHSGKIFPRSKKNFQNEKKKESASKERADCIKDHGEIATLETVQGEIIADNTELPAGIIDMIDEWMLEHALRYGIDIQKASGLQWRALCLCVGQHIKANKILVDREKQKTIGGTPYKPERVEKLLGLWEVYTSTYKHVPLAADFIAFSGVSQEWFYDTEKRLSSSQVEIAKKMRAIEERALSSAICDSRENPTGRIYYTKARLGWRESVEIVHTSATSVGTLDDIPKLTDSNG